MPCVKPLKAYQCFDGSIVFNELRRHDITRSLELPCGQCIGCRLERSRQWAMRCLHEAQLHKENAFITLTYNNDFLPEDGSLDYEHFQKFLKRLRKAIFPAKLRYYMAGEYGEKFGRPHYHACIFGYGFPDKKLLKRTSSGSLIYTSKILEDAWSITNPISGKRELIGHCSIGDVTFESAAYVARYIMKKQTGKHSDQHYLDQETGVIRKPEFNKMSLKPGIGYEWYKKYTTDVYPHDYVVIRGKKVKPPKFYDKKYKTDYPFEYDELLYKREKAAKLHFEDNTPERLAVKEQILEATLRKLKRTLT